MKPMWEIVAATALLTAGAIRAELPTTTQAPERRSYDFPSLAVNLNSLGGGRVVELKAAPTHWLHKFSPEVYKAYADCYDTYVAMVIEIPEEGLLRFYNQQGWGAATLSILAQRPIKESHKVYLYITQEPYISTWKISSQLTEQPFRIVAVGDDFIQNDDGTVGYIWTEAKSLNYTKQNKWTVDELSFFGKQLEGEGRVIEVTFAKIEKRVRNQTTGEITGWLVDDYRGEKFKVSFPKEAEKFIKATDHEGSSLFTYSTMYARAERLADGSLKLVPLGCRRQGNGEDVAYKW